MNTVKLPTKVATLFVFGRPVKDPKLKLFAKNDILHTICIIVAHYGHSVGNAIEPMATAATMAATVLLATIPYKVSRKYFLLFSFVLHIKWNLWASFLNVFFFLRAFFFVVVAAAGQKAE